METTSDNNKKYGGANAHIVRMAYAINNEQPVRCTIISDQPLFYMDFESELEDDEAFDLMAEDMGSSARSAPLTTKSVSVDKILELFQSDFSYATSRDATGRLGRDYSYEQAALVRTLESSRLASEYIRCMQRNGGQIILNTEVETSFYDRITGCIHINPNRPRSEQALLAARELRRMWQHRNGALINPLTFHPDQAVLVNRAQTADVMASMVRIAWEMQLAGEKDMWIRLESSPMSDLARAFAREAFTDFRTINNGTANCAVFEAWFLSDRCCNEDKHLIQQMLADTQGYVFNAESSSKAVTAELIAALGSMPFGKNYLSPYINTIITDVLFTEVRDRSNANFLWFIKFERSFKETERELQSGEELSGHDDRHGASRNKKTIRFGDHEKTAEIIALPAGKGDASMERGPPSDGDGRGARILPFRNRLGSA